MTVTAKAILADRMVDPGSLQIKGTRVATAAMDGATRTFLCGQYNSKNKLGGYTGFKTFIYEPAAMKGVLSVSDNLELDFFSADGHSDLSHDPGPAIRAGADAIVLSQRNRQYTNYAIAYLPVCLGAK